MAEDKETTPKKDEEIKNPSNKLEQGTYMIKTEDKQRTLIFSEGDVKVGDIVAVVLRGKVVEKGKDILMGQIDVIHNEQVRMRGKITGGRPFNLSDVVKLLSVNAGDPDIWE